MMPEFIKDLIKKITENPNFLEPIKKFIKRNKIESVVIIGLGLLAIIFVAAEHSPQKPIQNLLSQVPDRIYLYLLILAFSLIFIPLFIGIFKGEITNSTLPSFTKYLVLFALPILVIYIRFHYFDPLNTLQDELGNRFSWGEEYLIQENEADEKQAIYENPEAKIYNNNMLVMLQDKNPLKIAVSVPISRDSGIFDSREILRGVAIAQDEWNQSENKKVIIGIADDGYEASDDKGSNDGSCGKYGDKGECKAAKEMAEKLAKKDILGVIGHFSSGATQAAAQVYKDHQMVAISPTSTAVRTNEKKCSPKKDGLICLNPYIFRTALDDYINTEKLMRKVINHKDNRIAIVYESDSPYSNLFQKNFFDQMTDYISEENVIRNRIQLPICDMSKKGYSASDCLSELEKLNDKPDTLLLIPSTKSASLCDEQTNECYIKEILKGKSSNVLNLLGSDSMYKSFFLDQYAEGMRIVVTWHRQEEACKDNSPRLECKAAKIFSKNPSSDSSLETPYEISWRTATAYDATQTLLYGWQESNKMRNKLFFKSLKDVLSEKVVQNSYITKHGASNIPIKFNKEGDREKGQELGVVVKVDRKNGEFNFLRDEQKK